MATVIFIDIVKFSEYSSALSPSQIMEHLSIIFSKFDSIVSKYPLVTKIKLIGDVYMAAAGLFNPEEPPQNHAAQTINFALDALQALEEINAQLSSNLKVRIGINTNGPLIAGVLGTDKPVFDIIGDPINVSSRLQSTAVPNTIQISEETFKVICNLNYNIEKLGEIELKGKGKKIAYIVRSAVMGSFYQQSSESDET
jgi:class 3 adenylate cyclase